MFTTNTPKRPSRPWDISPRGSLRYRGILRSVGADFGFIEYDGGEDVFLHARKSRGALDGDEIVFEIIPGRGGKTEARVLEISRRSIEPKYGTLERVGRVATVSLYLSDLVLPVSSKDPLPPTGTSIGVIVEGFGRSSRATLVGILGRETDGGFEEKLLLAESGVRIKFPKEVEKDGEIQSLEDPLLALIGTGRRDLRSRTIITIDGADAKDLDDAIEVIPLQKWGYRLSVHIADVTHYVIEGGELDREAKKRGTSVYLADTVIPMLPPSLSNGACSLHPGSPKLCLSIDIDIALDGSVGRTEVYESLIETAHRGTYEEIELDHLGHPTKLPPLVREMLSHAWSMKSIMDARRKKEGKINFPSTESKLILEQGKLIRIESKKHLESHDLIETCMVLANEEIAKFSTQMKLPFLYRVHDTPSEDGLARLEDVFRSLQILFVSRGTRTTSLDVATAVRLLSEKDPEGLSIKSLLSSMSKALYSEKRSGHFGLALSHYSHFTSPIRRYPDLQIHRIIKSSLHQKVDDREKRRFESLLPRVAKDCSTFERRAERLEYDYRDLKIAIWLQDREGEIFRARITTILENGYFVEFLPHIEGFVRGKPPGKIFTELSVRLSQVDVRGRKIDCEVIN